MLSKRPLGPRASPSDGSLRPTGMVGNEVQGAWGTTTREGPLPHGNGPSRRYWSVPYLTGPMEMTFDVSGPIVNFTESDWEFLFLENVRSHENLPP